MLGFGAQTDTRIIRHGTTCPAPARRSTAHAVANYIAKYATKTLTAPGLPSQPDPQRRRHRAAALLGPLPAADHHRLAARRHPPGSRCRAWAHMLGYGGHFLTKSRRYSVTFGQLRAARTDHRRAARPPDADRDAWGRPLDETVVLVLPASGPTKAPAAPSPLTPNSPSPPPPAPASTTARPTTPHNNLPADQGRSMNT